MKITKRKLKRIIREEHRRLQEAGFGDKYTNPNVDPHSDHYDLDAKERAEMEISWLEELVYQEMDVVGAVRGHANRSRLAGKYYKYMVKAAQAKGDTLLVELLKAAFASSMPSKYREEI